MTFISLNFGKSPVFVPVKFPMSDNFVSIRVMPYGKKLKLISRQVSFTTFFLTFPMEKKIKKTEEKYSCHIHRCSKNSSLSTKILSIHISFCFTNFPSGRDQFNIPLLPFQNVTVLERLI